MARGQKLRTAGEDCVCAEGGGRVRTPKDSLITAVLAVNTFNPWTAETKRAAILEKQLDI